MWLEAPFYRLLAGFKSVIKPSNKIQAVNIMSRLAIVEYGVGIIQSVANAFYRLGTKPNIVNDGAGLLSLSPNHIVLPGVGAMGHALAMLRSRGLEEALTRLVREEKTPFLGICVGMQIMASRCNEFGIHQGLGWIPGEVSHLSKAGVSLCLPHIGWNTIRATSSHYIAQSVKGKDAYFLHSGAYLGHQEFVLATASYDIDFPCIIGKENMLGVILPGKEYKPVQNCFLHFWQGKLDMYKRRLILCCF